MKKRALLAAAGLAAAIGAAGLIQLAPRTPLGAPGDQVGELIDEIEAGRKPSGWIVDASVPLKAEPTAGAEVLSTLARGTPLVVGAEAGGWARVRVYGRKLQGWVPSSAIGAAEKARSGPP